MKKIRFDDCICKSRIEEHNIIKDELLSLMEQSPSETLDELRKDHEFLLKGDVFTSDLLEAWLSYKRETEVDQVRTRPHPWEYYLTFNA